MRLFKIPLLRRILLPLLKWANPGDITINHHYTKQSFRLHAFTHKGYWYHGGNREKATMNSFKRLIQPSDLVVEIGGHIGYVSQYFSQLVGARGLVYVFEPGENNLPYLRQNTERFPNIRIVPKAVSDRDGLTSFYLDDLTGQNNSILPDYRVFSANQKLAFTQSSLTKTQVESVKLDTFISQHALSPNFVKIDIEGAELFALKGMESTLTLAKAALMVEITNNCDEVAEFLSSFGYVLLDAHCKKRKSHSEVRGNTFCLHHAKHAELLTQLSIS